ncbi:MAG: hypothetical protein B7Y40_09150 [Gammaproteobacteria bacterium 28-57-27]|nr:MAG: hypothetical protein B7Y40_09150 [Gammaproteobacteria bacterium 28-57-27]
MGGAGHDVLLGGEGMDTLVGGGGDDNIRGDAAGSVRWSTFYGYPYNSDSELDWSLVREVRRDSSGAVTEYFTTITDGFIELSPTGATDFIYGGGGEDWIDGDQGDDVIDAGADNDVVFGGEGGDIIYGQGGEDKLYGNAGSQTPENDGTDFIHGGDEKDEIYGAGEGDYLYGEAGDDLIWGDGNGTLRTDNGNDSLYGGTGQDQLVGEGGDDRLYGEDDNDTLHGDQPDNFLAAEYHGTDELSGGKGDDFLYGGGQGDELYGGEGKDALWGDYDESQLAGQYHGADYLDGGDNDDQLIGGGAGDTLIGGKGNDLLWGDSPDQLPLLAEYHGNDFLYGNEGDDQLVGGSGDDYLSGGDDHDRLFGGEGVDTLDGGSGNDGLDGGTGADIMRGGLGDDSYVVDDVNDVLFEAADGGTDVVTSAVNITALPRYIEWLMLTGTSDTEATGNEDANALIGNAGANRLMGLEGNDQLEGRGGDDTLFGGAGRDQLYGGVGADVLHGESGNDYLVGGQGDDQLAGYAGDDIYVFNLGDGTDFIHNKDKLGATDTLRFGAGIHAANLTVFQAGADLYIGIGELGVSSDLVVVVDYYADVFTEDGSAFDSKIDRIEFADGTVWDQATIQWVSNGGGGGAVINHAPVLDIALADQSATQGEVFSYSIDTNSFTDPDMGDTLSYSATLADGSALPAWLSFDVATRTFSGTPDSQGVYSLRLTAMDQGGLSASDVFDLTIDAVNVNQAPVRWDMILADQSATQGEAFSCSIDTNTFFDHDIGDTLSYSATLADGTALPAWLSFDVATRTFSGTPDSQGTYSLRITAMDQGGLSASDVFDLTIEAAIVNHTPVLDIALADQSATQGDVFSYSIDTNSFTDPDMGDTLSYSATLADGSALPTWLSFDAVTRTFSGTPDGQGVYSLRLTATDQGGLSASDNFDLTVNTTNVPTPTPTPNLNGTPDADVLLGGTGDDWLNGGQGGDTYLFGLGSGHDTIWDYDNIAGNSDSIRLGNGINTDNLRITRDSSNLILTLASGDSLTINNWYIDPANRIESLQFANGTTWDAATLASLAIYQGNSGNDNLSVGWTSEAIHLQGLDGNDNLSSSNGDDTLEGGAGNDTLYASNGADTLDGGTGDDRLDGGQGNDTYLFGLGSGHDTIWDYDNTAGVNDNIRLGEGITAQDLRITRDGSNLILTLESGDNLTINNWYIDPANRIESLHFADGSVWDAATLTSQAIYQGTAGNDNLGIGWTSESIHMQGMAGDDQLSSSNGDDILEGGAGNDTLYASNGADILDGGSGNDWLDGGLGNDTYLFGRGGGHDTVWDYDWDSGNNDSLVFGPNIAAEQIWFRRDGGNLQVSVIGTDDSLTINNWYIDSANHLEQFKTADGHLLLDSQVELLVNAMASFAPPAAGQTGLPTDYQSALAPVIAANWS